MNWKFLRFCGFLLLFVALITTGSWAQTSRGTVSGTVTDTSGAVVPNASVQLINLATTVVRETKTTDTGLYRFDAVDLGIYKIEVHAAGFAVTSASGIQVRANLVSALDFVLKVGGSDQVVEVSGAAATVALQTEEQLRGANLDNKKITFLPISGQNSLNLLLTVPGIAPTRTGNGGGVGAVNGSRARANKFLIDGADNNDVSVAGQAITMYNNDAIQEVAIQTANFSAEFGRSGGAIVNQITKSGTNNLHGTLAWVYLSQLFNASTKAQRTSYANQLANPSKYPNPVLKPKNHENIPAFTVGGPVYIPHIYDGHNKTFWFFAGQWDHYTSNGSTYSFTVPTAAGIALLQNYASTCPNVGLYLKSLGGMVAATSTSSVDLSVPASVYGTSPTCNGNARTGVKMDVGTGTRVVPNSYKTYNMQFRIDHVINDKQNVSVRVFRSNERDQLYDAGISPAFDTSGTFGQWNSALTHTYAITNTFTNELRANYAQTTYEWPGQGDGSALSQLPTFTISSVSGFGMSANYPQGRIPNTYQLQDVATKVVGHHQFRFGWEYFRQIARQYAPTNLRGSLGYVSSGSSTAGTLVSAFANFMDDYSGVTTGTRLNRVFGSNVYHPTYSSTAGFFQDSWKVTSDLTLNLGVRWDYFGQPANIFKYPAVSFDPTGWSNARIPTDNNNFGPSVGFAWNPKHGFLMGDGKTVVRGGFQVSYDTSFNNLLSNMATGYPNNPQSKDQIATSGRGLAGLYNVRFPALVASPLDPKSNGTSQFPMNIRSPYTERWSLGFQRELPAGLFMDIAYVGSASHKLNQQQELNPYGLPVQNTDGTWSAGPRLNPAIGGRMVRANAANSNYNALQLEVKKRYGNLPYVGSMMFDSSYTWSKTLGVVDDVFSTSPGTGVYMSANPLRPQYNGWRNSDYGPSDNDRRHNWVTSVVWDLPSPKMRFVDKIVGGWSLSGIVSLRSGVPYSVWNGADRDFDGYNGNDRPDIGNWNAPLNSAAQAVATSTCSTGWQTLYGNGCVKPTDVRFLYYPSNTAVSYSPFVAGKEMQRNSLYTSAFFSTDASIIKTFKITESKSLEYRAEIFNFANSQNYSFTPANNSLSTMFNSKDKTTGIPTATFLDFGPSSTTATGNRTMRMGLKLIF